ncbi:MAG: hypothetical protein RUDDFDWM_001505 [Candidatus Fervidibacterota bacterium]
MGSDTIRMLCELIEIPSVNPQLASPSEPKTGEVLLSEYIAQKLEAVGISVIRQPVVDGRENIIALVEGRSGSETIMLCAHMDTVSGEGMRLPFTPIVKEGKVYGRGACDTKASIAAMLTSIMKSTTTGRIKKTVVFAATVDEEYTATGAVVLRDWLKEQKFGLPNLCIVGEPTELKVATAHKGFIRFHIRTFGKSAHSSQPHMGINAIYRMAKLIPLIEKYSNEVLANLRHPTLGAPTISANVIKGGHAPNVIPDVCEIFVDYRTLPSQDPMDAWKKLKEYIMASPDIDFQVEFEQPEIIDSGMETPDVPSVATLIKLVKEVLGEAQRVGVPYSTDASKFASIGIPSVVFGPGSIAQAHSSEEFVEVEQVEAYASIIERLIGDE